MREVSGNLLKIDIFLKKPMYLLRHIRDMNLGGGIFAYRLCHMIGLRHKIRHKQCSKHSQRHTHLKKGEQHGHESGLQPEMTHIPSHYRLHHICKKTCHHKRQQDTFKQIKKVKRCQCANHREDYSHHPIEGIRTAIIKVVHKWNLFAFQRRWPHPGSPTGISFLSKASCHTLSSMVEVAKKKCFVKLSIIRHTCSVQAVKFRPLPIKNVNAGEPALKTGGLTS